MQMITKRLEGYAGFKKAFTMPPKDVLEVIKAATVKGRGGAGFPAGIKWSLMAPNRQFRSTLPDL